MNGIKIAPKILHFGILSVLDWGTKVGKPTDHPFPNMGLRDFVSFALMNKKQKLKTAPPPLSKYGTLRFCQFWTWTCARIELFGDVSFDNDVIHTPISFGNYTTLKVQNNRLHNYLYSRQQPNVYDSCEFTCSSDSFKLST